MTQEELQARTAFEMYFGREDEGDDEDMYEYVIYDIKEYIAYYEEGYKEWNSSKPPLERPQYIGLYDYVFDMEETIKLKNMYEELCKIACSSSFPPNTKFKLEECRAYWHWLKELMENKHGLTEEHFVECLWLHISGCPRTITTNIAFEYDVCKVILESVESNENKYIREQVSKALIEKGYSEILVHRITDSAHSAAYRMFNSFTHYLTDITEQLER